MIGKSGIAASPALRTGRSFAGGAPSFKPAKAKGPAVRPAPIVQQFSERRSVMMPVMAAAAEDEGRTEPDAGRVIGRRIVVGGRRVIVIGRRRIVIDRRRGRVVVGRRWRRIGRRVRLG